ncbi:MAG TPA: DUF2027 domain-containing protein, partial [Salinivirgaceae bacterium]|nr:DUF2027 domain-containing protein [Salinivirgaceae bacterium]
HKKMIFFPQGKLLVGKNQPKIFFGFVSIDPKIASAKSYDVVIVNDSNYTVFYTIYQIDTLQNSKVYVGILAPNQQEKIVTIDRTMLQNIVEYKIHSIFYSNEKLPIVEPWNSSFEVDCQLFERDSAFKLNQLFEGYAFVHKLKNETTENISLEKAIQQSIQDNTVKIKEKVLLDTSVKKVKTESKTSEKLREIDLHIQVLLEDTGSMTPKEILDYQMSIFRKELERAIIDQVERIVFIHGLGNGTLKTEIRKTLDREYKQYRFHDASFKEYGFGATMVMLKR